MAVRPESVSGAVAGVLEAVAFLVVHESKHVTESGAVGW